MSEYYQCPRVSNVTDTSRVLSISRSLRRYARLSTGASLGIALMCSLGSTVANAQISFTNATDSSLNGALRSESWGISVGDLNGDNWPDIFVGNHRNRASLYQYDGNGKWWNNILQRDTSASWLRQPYIDTHGAAWSDFDGDGDEDIVVGTNAGTYHFLMISQGNTLKNESETRLREDTSSSYSTWFDFDQDGLTDLFQGRDSGNLSVHFRQQPGNGIFDASEELPGCDGDWAFLTDVNDDDVADYVCNKEGAFPKAGYSFSNGVFQDITASLPSVSNVVDSLAADFNNDLRSDLLTIRGAISASGAVQHSSTLIEVSSDTGNNEEVIFSFNGGGPLNLSSWAPPVSRDNQLVSGSTVIGGFNINYDSSNDLWTIRRTSSTWEYAYLRIQSSSAMTNLQNVQVSNRDKPIIPELYRRDNGSWTRSTAASGLNIPLECKSVVAADLDNDMDQDLYMVCGRGAENISNRLFSNDGNGNFTEVPNAGGAMGELGAPISDAAGSGESVVTGDFNNDGWIDLFVTNGNNSQPVRSRVGRHELMLNNGSNGNHWIQLKLQGTISDADATGARIVATTGGVSQLRESGANYHRWSQNHNRIHFGLGSNTTVDLTIRWPRGLVEQFNNVQADAIYTLTEGSGLTLANVTPPAAFPQPVAGDECRASRYTDDMDSGLFIYKDCTNNSWHIRATSALEYSHTFAAELQASAPVTIGSQLSVEANDQVFTNNSQLIFSLNTTNGDMDGFNFTLPAGSNCLTLTSPLTDGARVMLGANHVPVTLPINLETLGACTQGGNSPPVLTVPGAQSTPEFDSVSLQLTATDIDGDALVFSANGLPTGLSISNDGLVSGSADSAGTYTVIVNVTDANGASDSGSFQWTVESPSSNPGLSVADVSVNESNGTGEFVVTLSPPNPSQTVTVTAAGVRLTATPGQDYYGFIRTLSFAPNESTKTIPVTILDDSIPDPDEKLGVRLYGASNATIADGAAEMLIVDNDTGGNAAPVFNDPGDQQSTINNSLTLSVTATDSDGDTLTYSATGLPTGLTQDNASGEISGTPNSLGSFNVTLSVTDGNGGSDQSSFVWTIVDAPVTPTLSVTDISVPENAGTADITVTLTPANPTAAVSVNVAATRITATPGADYYGFFRNLEFAPNEVTKTVSVTILDDTVIDPDEQFGVRLFNAVNAALGNRTAVVTIIDDDTGGNSDPVLTVPGDRQSNRNESTSLTLNATDPDGDTLSYSATGLPTGMSIDSVSGVISGTPSVESTYTVNVQVTDGNGGSDSGSFQWTILDPVTVTLSIDGVSVDESAGTMDFTVTKTPANANSIVSVEVATSANGTATQGSDYYGLTGNLEFATNESVKTVSVTILDDNQQESDETVVVRLLNPVNAVLANTEATGTIIDNDNAPNTRPELTNPGNQTAPLNSSVNLVLSASDIDGDTLSFSASGLPAGLQINNTTGVISGTTSAVGTYSVQVTVSDGNGGADTDPFQFSVFYFDGFETSSNWTTNPYGNDSASTGLWSAGNPDQTADGSNVMQPGFAANGSRAMITDPDGSGGLGCCDIDNGVTTVRSPEITLGPGPHTMSFNYYLAYLTNATSSDYFRVRIETSSGTQTVFIENAAGNSTKTAAWKSRSVDLSSYAGRTIRIILQATDFDTPSLVEAGLDDMRIE